MLLFYMEVFVLSNLFNFYESVPTSRIVGPKEYCIDDCDCPNDECCIGGGVPYWVENAEGNCQKSGTIGSECITLETMNTTTGEDLRYYGICPCSEELDCEGTGHWTSLGEEGVCRHPCNSTNDCNPGHCCVSKYTQTRKRDIQDENTEGYCQPYGERGSQCFIGNVFRDNQDTWLVYCPCKPELMCKDDGNTAIPLGPTGRCEISDSSRHMDVP